MQVTQIVAEAVAALIGGDPEAGERILTSIDAFALARQKAREKDAARVAARLSAARTATTVSLAPHGVRNPPPAIQFPMFVRDGFSCRYGHCQRRTIIPPVFRALSLRYPDVIRWNKNWRDTHPVVWLYTASVEHIVPWTVSRSSHPETNLITTCYWCNQVKSTRRKQDLGWEIVDPTPTSWDGLAGSLRQLVNIVSTRTDVGARAYFNAWVGAVQTGPSSITTMVPAPRRITIRHAIEPPHVQQEPAPNAETTARPSPVGAGEVASGMVVQAVAEHRSQARNYRVEHIRNARPIGREFWYTGSRQTDGLCVYSTELRVLAEVRKIYSATAPIEHLRRSQQLPGAFLT
jgi:hypothetical protein